MGVEGGKRGVRRGEVLEEVFFEHAGFGAEEGGVLGVAVEEEEFAGAGGGGGGCHCCLGWEVERLR